MAVSFTLCVKDRLVGLAYPSIFEHLKSVLLQELQGGKCGAHVYFMMPDHCHLLLEGADDTANTLVVVKRFKQRTGYWFSQCGSALRWQKDFYDHILRNDQDVRKQVDYILRNPIRKELTLDWLQYPYKGSTLYNFSEW